MHGEYNVKDILDINCIVKRNFIYATQYVTSLEKFVLM
jgi:hypothetical protein